ncbi:alpha/beta fold hydrolase [Burkholderia sp. A1]|uniref:alpha/beta fold hydrolase n=1 Tax=Burkholderia sp. A1 TaxID=148446 RepID=UPI0004686B81|nr:alpha/beta fold hydrolase [Burkholderia sp. A1]
MRASLDYCHAADGVRLGFRRLGDGPPLLLIAGLAGEAQFWTPVLDELARRHGVIVFDQRGFGASDASTGACTIDQLADDALAILDAAGVDSAIVAGHSTGGAIAQAMALDHPSRVSHLVLSASWAKADAYMHYLFDLRSRVMRVGGKQLYADLTRVIGYPLSWLRQQPGQLALREAQAPVEIDERVFTRIEALLAFDRAAALPSIRQPTLVLGARDDQIIPHYLHVALYEAIPGASARFCTEGGHFFPRVRPSTFIDPLVDWLEQQA